MATTVCRRVSRPGAVETRRAFWATRARSSAANWAGEGVRLVRRRWAAARGSSGVFVPTIPLFRVIPLTVGACPDIFVTEDSGLLEYPSPPGHPQPFLPELGVPVLL